MLSIECKLELNEQISDEEKIKAKIKKIKNKMYSKKIYSQNTKRGQKQLNLLFMLDGYIEYQVVYNNYIYSTSNIDRAIKILQRLV